MKKILGLVVLFVILSVTLLSDRVYAATKTWDGGGSNDNLSTPANWAGDSAPVAGDDLVFPTGASRLTINNDYVSGTNFNSITTNGVGTNQSYAIAGNAITLGAGGINATTTGPGTNLSISLTITLGASQTFSRVSEQMLMISGSLVLGSNNLTIDGEGFMDIDGAISGSGSITKSGSGWLRIMGNNAAYSGSIVANAGYLIIKNGLAFGTSPGGTIINSGASLFIDPCEDVSDTISEDITLNGSSSSEYGPKLRIGSICDVNSWVDSQGYGTNAATQEYTFSGSITLGSDAVVGILASKATFTGPINGSHAMNLIPGWTGAMVLNSPANGSTKPNGTYVPDYQTVTLSDESLSSFGIQGNTRVVLNGRRGGVGVDSAAILSGTGVAGNVWINNNAKLAPGDGVGCLSTGNVIFTNSSSYVVELGGGTECSGHDQLKVTGTVDLGSAELSAGIVNGSKLEVGSKFVVISNDGSDAIVGIFRGLPEGSTFNLAGYVLGISYVGGDGNDIVLTVLSVSTSLTPPNTGLKLIRANALGILLFTSTCAGLILLFSRMKKISI